jgi:ParB-like chromosome segregation protein Spo0J
MKNRIKEHRTVRVGDLVPHELNPRTHSQEQREALEALLGEIGFARSLLAYELPDGRLKLIDGHLRRGTLDPNEQITVEVLDLSDDEARKLLLSIDPLAQLAEYDDRALEALRQTVDSDNEVLAAFWSSLHRQDALAKQQLKELTGSSARSVLPEQFAVMVECADEMEQKALLQQFHDQGLKCRALVS